MRRNRSEVGAIVDALVGGQPPGSGTRVPPDTDRAPPPEPEPEPEPQTAKPPPPLFASGHLGEGIQPDFARIVETVYAVDAFRDYDDLEKHLEVGDDRGDYGALREHLDKAEVRARRAHRLYLGAKLELANWEARTRKVSSVMREKARRELEDEKLAGERKKVISKEDVEDRMGDIYQDEYSSQQVTRAKLKGVVDDLEHLAQRWNSKCGDLRTLLETLRK